MTFSRVRSRHGLNAGFLLTRSGSYESRLGQHNLLLSHGQS